MSHASLVEFPHPHLDQQVDPVSLAATEISPHQQEAIHRRDCDGEPVHEIVFGFITL